MAINIRDARPADANEIAQFNLLLAAETEQLQLDLKTVTTGVSTLLADPARGHYWVAENDGTLVGQIMVTLEWSDWHNGVYWWIGSVFVDAAWRGQGVFRMLYEQVVAAARSTADCRAIRLYVDKHNERAKAVYQTLGMHHSDYSIMELTLTPTTDKQSC
ncbi:MAG: GNAT family N-acetyltransferase [Proteobacteria bacterium]|nr:GNAT family N-acetyltransferase [Pseudomonadota bacterium]